VDVWRAGKSTYDPLEGHPVPLDVIKECIEESEVNLKPGDILCIRFGE